MASTSMDGVSDAMLCTSRRSFLATAGAFVAWSGLPRAAYAGSRDPRLVVVILRGAMDGLAVVPPIGDPDYERLRGGMAIGAAGLEPVKPLDGFFGLNDAMPHLHALYQQRQALMVHAAATPYRERSHFDGQDVLESGLGGPGRRESGWLNRAAAEIPRGDGVRPVSGLAVSPTVPLILRGAAPTLSWTPPRLQAASGDTMQRLLGLYDETDPDLAAALMRGLDLGMLATDLERADGRGLTAQFNELAAGAGRLVAAEDGPRLAALSFDGWDTHTNEGAEDGRLAGLLVALDGALDALATELALVWSDSVIVVMTEFGRTARANGNSGTDHGTATTALMLGGAVKGGRVIADWPGLSPASLHENRDLKPTIDLRAILKGVLRDHLGIDRAALDMRVFPGSLGVNPHDGLIG